MCAVNVKLCRAQGMSPLRRRYYLIEVLSRSSCPFAELSLPLLLFFNPLQSRCAGERDGERRLIFA